MSFNNCSNLPLYNDNSKPLVGKKKKKGLALLFFYLFKKNFKYFSYWKEM